MTKRLFPKPKFNDEKKQITMDEIMAIAKQSMIENKKILDALEESGD